MCMDKMLRAASKGLSDYVPQEDIDAGTVYPDLIKLRDISAVVSLPANLLMQQRFGL